MFLSASVWNAYFVPVCLWSTFQLLLKQYTDLNSFRIGQIYLEFYQFEITDKFYK
jgi:hypothetical protein